MPSRKASPTTWNEALVEQLHTFMQVHDIGLEEFADFLETEPHVLSQWFEGSAVAPACSLIALSSMSHRPQARAYRSQSKEEALRRVQAI